MGNENARHAEAVRSIPVASRSYSVLSSRQRPTIGRTSLHTLKPETSKGNRKHFQIFPKHSNGGNDRLPMQSPKVYRTQSAENPKRRTRAQSHDTRRKSKSKSTHIGYNAHLRHTISVPMPTAKKTTTTTTTDTTTAVVTSALRSYPMSTSNSTRRCSIQVTKTLGVKPSSIYHAKKRESQCLVIPTELKSEMDSSAALSNNRLSKMYASPSPNHTVDGDADNTISAMTTSHHLNNGINGIYLSDELIDIAYEFWSDEIETLSDQQFIELAMLNYSTLFTKIPAISRMWNSGDTVKISSQKMIAMIGKIVVCLHRDDWDMFEYVLRLGEMHQTIGVQSSHYKTMLECLDISFSEFFGAKFSVRIKYALDLVLSLIIRIMEKDNITNVNRFIERSLTSHKSFLKSIDDCINSETGFKYLSIFLKSQMCDEMITFLHIYKQFHNAMGDEQRLFYARKLIDTCLDANISNRTHSNSEINVSHDSRISTIAEVSQLVSDYNCGQLESVRIDLFDNIYFEIKKLIQSNFWYRFVAEYC